MKKTWAWVRSMPLIYILLCGVIYFSQRALIYHPTAATSHPFEVMKINNGGHTVEVIITNPDNDQAIIYFGGNAENVAYSAVDFERNFPGHSTYLMKYRGYGGAQGSASEANLFADSLVLFDHINKPPTNNITIMGRSLGSGVAAYLATERSAAKLILVTPFDSIRDMAQSMLPFLPIQWLLQDHFDSKSRAEQFKTPTLVVRAIHDQVIPAHHTLSLVASIPDHLATMADIKAGHNDLDLMPEYFQAVNQFLIK